jgi:hypothetical protein
MVLALRRVLPLSLYERLTTSSIAKRCQPASKIDQLPASNIDRGDGCARDVVPVSLFGFH